MFTFYRNKSLQHIWLFLILSIRLFPISGIWLFNMSRIRLFLYLVSPAIHSIVQYGSMEYKQDTLSCQISSAYVHVLFILLCMYTHCTIVHILYLAFFMNCQYQNTVCFFCTKLGTLGNFYYGNIVNITQLLLLYGSIQYVNITFLNIEN